MPIIADADELVSAADLVEFEGAPFDEPVVQSAAQAIRDAASWHIAPVREEIVIVETAAGQESVFLNTRQLVEVTSVRDVTDAPDGPIVTGYRTHATATFVEGQVKHPSGWPGGVLAFTVRHGYAGCPASLAAVVAEMCRAIERGDLTSRSLGDRTESWRSTLSTEAEASLGAYSIAEGFA